MGWGPFKSRTEGRSLRRWLSAIVGGTLAGTWSGVVVLAVWKRNVWLVVPGLMLGSALAGVQMIVLGSVDVVFAALGLRKLPVGAAAWLGATAAPALVFFAVQSWPFPSFHGPASFVWSGVGPMVVSSVAVRLFWGGC